MDFCEILWKGYIYAGMQFFFNRCYTQTLTDNHFTALWILSGTAWVSWYQKKHSPIYTYRGHESLHLFFVVTQFGPTKEHLFTARCAIVQSAVFLLHVICLSVCDVGGS